MNPANSYCRPQTTTNAEEGSREVRGGKETAPNRRVQVFNATAVAIMATAPCSVICSTHANDEHSNK